MPKQSMLSSFRGVFFDNPERSHSSSSWSLKRRYDQAKGNLEQKGEAIFKVAPIAAFHTRLINLYVNRNIMLPAAHMFSLIAMEFMMIQYYLKPMSNGEKDTVIDTKEMSVILAIPGMLSLFFLYLFSHKPSISKKEFNDTLQDFNENILELKGSKNSVFEKIDNGDWYEGRMLQALKYHGVLLYESPCMDSLRLARAYFSILSSCLSIYLVLTTSKEHFLILHMSHNLHYWPILMMVPTFIQLAKESCCTPFGSMVVKKLMSYEHHVDFIEAFLKCAEDIQWKNSFGEKSQLPEPVARTIAEYLDDSSHEEQDHSFGMRQAFR